MPTAKTEKNDDIKKLSAKLKKDLEDFHKASNEDVNASQDEGAAPAGDDGVEGDVGEVDGKYDKFPDKQGINISDKFVAIVDAIIADLQKLQDALHDAQKGMMTSALMKVVGTIQGIFVNHILPALTKDEKK